MDLRVGSVCDRGLSHKRPVNEDRCLVLADAGLFVVCDGVGGHNSGEVASQLAIDTIEEALSQFDGNDVEDLLRNAIRYANRDIFEMASSQPAYDGMGTTVALLYIDRDGNRAVVGHAGDSRVYRYDGSLHRETYDHTDLDDAIRSGRISPQQALQRGKQNTINRALGIESDVVAEYKTIAVADGDAFLVCSDGITRHVDDDEIDDLFSQSLTPDEMCEELRARCYSRGAEDNLTAIVVRTDAGASAPASAKSASVTRKRIDFDRAPVPNRLVEPRRTSEAGRLAVIAATAILTAVVGFGLGWWWSTRAIDAAPTPTAAAAGRSALERGDGAAARTIFAGLVQIEPARADYQYWLGRACLAQGDAHEAVVHLEESSRLDAQSSETLLYLAAAYQSDDRPRDAGDALKRYAEAAAKGSTTAAPSSAATRAR